jgi:T-complex protein 1 subunit theta
MGLHPSEIVSGYKKAGIKALEVIEGMACETVKNVRDEEEVAKFLKPVIASKQYGEKRRIGVVWLTIS